jgi:iron(III) transport system permease protein
MKESVLSRGPRLALLVLVFWLAGMPVVSLLLGAARDPASGAWTTALLRKVFLTTEFVRPLLSTLELSAYVGLLTTVVGLAVAWIMARLRPPGGLLLEIGIMAPIFISPFIGAVGWLTLGQPNTGIINVLLARAGLPGVNIISYGGTVFIMVLFFLPYTYTLLRHTLDRLNPELEEAAAICGATRRGTVFGVVLPLIWPSILSSVILTFVLAAEMFSIPGLTIIPHGQVLLSNTVFERAARWPINQSEAAAVGLILLIVTIIGMAIYALSVRVQARFITVGPRSPRAAEQAGWTTGRTAGVVFVVLYIACSSLLPVFAIFMRSMIPFYSGEITLEGMSSANIESTLSDPSVLDSLGHSLLVMAVTTVALLALAFLVALGRVRARGALSTLTLVVASVPIAVPGVLIGVGFIWLYVGTPVYASLAIIMLVMLARFLPILVRLFETGLIQLGRELDEAAAVCGASDLAVTWRIRLPLLVGTIRSAATIAMTQVLNELTASALLFTSITSVLPVLIFNYMYDGDYARASAIALLQIAIMATLLTVIGLASLARKRSVAAHAIRQPPPAAAAAHPAPVVKPH